MLVHKVENLPNVISGLNLPERSCIAFIFCEDRTLIDETVKFFQKRAFDQIFLFITEPEQARKADKVQNIAVDYFDRKDIWAIINSALPTLLGHWLYWGLNGEFFYYPFCESRSVQDLADFMTGERRYNIAGTVFDLYTGDIKTHSDGISIINAHFDRTNYYARDCQFKNIEIDEAELERIKFLYGGLRWRFSEYVPASQRRIDRVPFFCVTSNLSFTENGLTERPEFFTYRCEHHHNTTCAVMSFEVARYLRFNHDLRVHVGDFMWEGSQKFRWNSSQLLRMGLMETGQWF